MTGEAKAAALEAPRESDVGNALRLVAQHGEQIRHVHLWNSWVVWDGRRWRRDESGEMARRAKSTVQTMYEHAIADSSPDRRAAMVKHAVRSEGEARLRAMVNLAASETGIPVRPDELDQDPWLFNAANGTVDLRTGELRPHGEEDLITKISPASYRPGARCPTWLKFLDRVFAGDDELVEFLRRAVGYTLTGLTVEQVLFLLHGGGQNGKTTMLEVIRHVLGDYASQVPADTLMATRQVGGIPNDLARLPGARFVSAVETDEGRRLAEGLVKRITGSDTITARFLHAEFFDFRPQFALWLAANHLPGIRGTDDAIWRRIRLVPFTVKIPEAERDPHLDRKLLAEADGILTWAIEGALAWHQYGLTQPSAVTRASTDYRAEQDALGDFITERCITDETVRAAVGGLYKAYVAWCEGCGEKARSNKWLTQALERRGIDRYQDKTGARTRFYIGIGLLTTGHADIPNSSEQEF